MPFTTDTAACAKCKFFDTKGSAEEGLCRYNPPVSAVAGAISVWPKVEANDWCGHFEAAAA